MNLNILRATREKQFLALQLAGWIGWILLFWLQGVYYESFYDSYGAGRTHFIVLLTDASVGFILTYMLRYVYRAVWEKPLVARILSVVLASYVASLIWQPIKNFMLWNYWQDCHECEKMLAEDGYWNYFTGLLQLSYFLFIGWSGLYFGIKYYQLLQEEQQKSIKAISMAHEAQLRMLRYQLNPHFLFNTLNAISTLILESKNKTANSMVVKLSNFLRYSLDNDPMQKVALEQEINTMKLYLEIEKVRFEDGLRIEIDTDELSRHAQVPSLLLQPLVENSIKYAVAASENGGTVRIKARVFAQELLLEISDDGPGIDMTEGNIPEFPGVGVNNTRNRLKQIYGADHS